MPRVWQICCEGNYRAYIVMSAPTQSVRYGRVPRWSYFICFSTVASQTRKHLFAPLWMESCVSNAHRRDTLAIKSFWPLSVVVAGSSRENRLTPPNRTLRLRDQQWLLTPARRKREAVTISCDSHRSNFVIASVTSEAQPLRRSWTAVRSIRDSKQHLSTSSSHFLVMAKDDDTLATRQTEVTSPEITCSICLQMLSGSSKRTSLPCKHQFHKQVRLFTAVILPSSGVL